MSQQTIPLSAAPNQTLKVSLLVDGAALTLILFLSYNEIAKYWVMSIFDKNNQLLVAGVPLVTGNFPACNVLVQFAYLQIGSAYVINQSGTKIASLPDNITLGTDFVLVWGNTPKQQGFFTATTT